MATINLGEIVIKDFTSSTLAKLQKTSISTEGAVRKMMKGIKDGGKNAVPSIETLSYRLDKLRERRDRSFSRRNIRLFNQEIKKTERQLERLKNLPPLSISERFRSLGKSISSNILPIGLVATGAIAIRSAFSLALNTGMAFGKEMSNVQALSNASTGEFKKLTATARELGATTVFSATQAAQGMSYLAMAGFNTNQIISSTPAVLSLAAAGSIEMGEAADIASNVLSQFGMTAEETSRIADVMAKTITTSNTNMQEMGEAMKYLGPTARAMGMELEESSAVVGLLANSGIKGSLASRALGTALTRLTKPTSQMQGAMSELGVQFFDNKGHFVGMSGVVNQLEKSFIGLNDKQRSAYLSTIFGVESFQEMSILLENGSNKIKAYTDDLILSQGVADRIAETKLDNLAGDWTKLKSVVSEFAIQSYNAIKPFMRSVTKGFTSFIGVLSKSGKLFKSLGVGLAVYISLASASAIATKGMAIAKGAWSVITTILTAKQWALNSAMLANPILAVVAGVVAAISYFVILANTSDGLSASQRALKNVQDEVIDATNNERVELGYLIDLMEDANTSLDMKTKAYEKLKRLYPDILSEYENEKDTLNSLDEIQKKIINNIEARARKEVAAKLYKQSFEDEIKKREEIEEDKNEVWYYWDDSDRLQKDLKGIYKAREQYKSLMGDFVKGDLEINPNLTKTEVEANNTSTIEQTTENIVTGGKKQTVLTINIEKVIENIDQKISDGVGVADNIVDEVLDGLTRRIHGTARGLIN